MKTLLLMSVIWMTFVLPAVAARAAHPVRAVRTMSLGFAAFVVVYYLYVAYGHTRLFVPHG